MCRCTCWSWSSKSLCRIPECCRKLHTSPPSGLQWISGLVDQHHQHHRHHLHKDLLHSTIISPYLLEYQHLALWEWKVAPVVPAFPEPPTSTTTRSTRSTIVSWVVHLILPGRTITSTWYVIGVPK